MGKFRQDIDRNKLEAEYITSLKSYRDLADEFGVPFKSVCVLGREGEWRQKRKKYRESVVTKTVNKTAEKESKKLSKLISSADKAAGVIEKALSDSQQFNRYVITQKEADGSETTQEYMFDKTDTKALRDIVACLKDLTAVMRNLNNIPTASETEQMNIQREKLEIEKKKAEDGSDRDSNITVTFGNAGETDI